MGDHHARDPRRVQRIGPDRLSGGCGGVGPFPVFRRQDCGKELSKSTWDFHQEYGTTCNQEDTTQKMENKKKEEDKRKHKHNKKDKDKDKDQSKGKNKGDDDDDDDDSSGGSGAVTPGNSKPRAAMMSMMTNLAPQ